MIEFKSDTIIHTTELTYSISESFSQSHLSVVSGRFVPYGFGREDVSSAAAGFVMPPT